MWVGPFARIQLRSVLSKKKIFAARGAALQLRALLTHLRGQKVHESLSPFSKPLRGDKRKPKRASSMGAPNAQLAVSRELSQALSASNAKTSLRLSRRSRKNLLCVTLLSFLAAHSSKFA